MIQIHFNCHSHTLFTDKHGKNTRTGAPAQKEEEQNKKTSLFFAVLMTIVRALKLYRYHSFVQHVKKKNL